MNRALPRAWLLSLLIAAPSAALAQDNPPAESPPAEVAPEAEKAPVAEEKKDDDKKDEKKDEEKKDEAAPAAAVPSEPAPVPADEPAMTAPSEATPTEPGMTAPADATAASETEEDKNKDAALSAATGVPVDSGRPWQVLATVEASLGTGTFVADEFARQPSLGWTVIATGYYKLTDLFQGRLDAYGRIGWDQTLTNNATSLGTRPREFFLRDTTLGVTGRGLYKEEFTGIVFGGSSAVALPTSKASQAQDRLFRWSIGGTASRTFAEIGPGSIVVALAEGWRKDFGPAAPTLGEGDSQTRFHNCGASNRVDSGDCVSNIATANWGLTHSLTGTYILDNLSVSLSMVIYNQWTHDLRDASELPGTLRSGVAGTDVGSSPNAQNEGNYSTLTQGTIEVGYQVIPEFGLALGLTTLQNPVIQRGDNPSALRFPFFDFDSYASNLSAFYLDANFTY